MRVLPIQVSSVLDHLKASNSEAVPPAQLFIHPSDAFYSPSAFGPSRFEVPPDFGGYTYLTAPARHYYLPGFLVSTIEQGENAGDIVFDILRDFTEPSMLVSEDRLLMWRLLLDSEPAELDLFAVCLPILEEVAAPYIDGSDWEEPDRERRGSQWIKPSAQRRANHA